MGVTAAHRLISGTNSLNLVDYVESLRAPIAASASQFGMNRRDFQATVGVRVNGQHGAMVFWVYTEGLN